MFRRTGDQPVIRTVPGALALVLLVGNGGSPEAGRTLNGRQTLTDDTAHSSRAVRTTSGARSMPGVIVVNYEWMDGGTARPTVAGQPMRVRVSVVAVRPVGALSAEVYAHEGLVLSPMNWAMPNLPANESAGQILTVTPYVTGPSRFSILAQGKVDGRPQAAQITVPVPGEMFENR